MIRQLAAILSLSAMLMVARSARADAAPGACCGPHGRHYPPRACTAVDWTTATTTCQECASTDSACIDPLGNSGYQVACTRTDPAGEVQVWCKDAQASSAGRSGSIPLAGLLILASLWAGLRVGRHRPE